MDQNEAFKRKIDPVEEEKTWYKEQIRRIANNWGKIAAIAIAVLSSIQYAYKFGVCQAFHLPISVISIQLVEYLPLAALFFTLSVYIIDIYVSHPVRKIHFSPFRIICATTINFVALSMIFNSDEIPAALLLLVSLVIALLAEFFLKKAGLKHIQERLVSRYQDRMKNDTNERLLYRYMVKPGVVFIMILVLVIPFISQMISSRRNTYEICTIGEEDYAVILNVSDNLLLQPVIAEGHSLTIYTGSYRIMGKTDIDEYAFHTFDHVTIAEGTKPDDDEEAHGDTAVTNEGVPEA